MYLDQMAIGGVLRPNDDLFVHKELKFNNVSRFYLVNLELQKVCTWAVRASVFVISVCTWQGQAGRVQGKASWATDKHVLQGKSSGD